MQATEEAPLTSVAAQQAQAEGLELRVAENRTGYYGVHLNKSCKPYAAQVSRGGKKVYLGIFATAEEAALCVARSPEGQAAAGRRRRLLTGMDTVVCCVSIRVSWLSVTLSVSGGLLTCFLWQGQWGSSAGVLRSAAAQSVLP